MIFCSLVFENLDIRFSGPVVPHRDLWKIFHLRFYQDVYSFIESSVLITNISILSVQSLSVKQKTLFFDITHWLGHSGFRHSFPGISRSGENGGRQFFENIYEKFLKVENFPKSLSKKNKIFGYWVEVSPRPPLLGSPLDSLHVTNSSKLQKKRFFIAKYDCQSLCVIPILSVFIYSC